MKKLVALSFGLLYSAVLAQGPSYRGIQTISLHSGLGETFLNLNFDAANAPELENRLYNDSDAYWSEEAQTLPTGWENARLIKTLHSDRGTTGATVYTNTLGAPSQVGVAHATAISSKPTWLTTNYTETTLLITNNLDDEYAIWVANFSAGSLVTGGNTTDSGMGNPNYFILINEGYRTADVPSPTQISFQSGSSGEDESQAIVITAERSISLDGAVGVDVDDNGAGQTCSEGSDYVTFTGDTLAWVDGVGSTDTTTITANAVSADCTVVFDLSSYTGGAVAGSITQHILTIQDTAAPAADLFVSPTGSDAADCTTGTPCLTIQKAISVVSCAQTIEVESDPDNTTEYYQETLTPTTDCSAGNEITVQGEAGDTIIVWQSGADILDLTTGGVPSYWIFKDLQLGRDETLNGWAYGIGCGSAVEHTKPIDGRNVDLHHIKFDGLTIYGGKNYNSSDFRGDIAHHLWFLDTEFHYTGCNDDDGTGGDRGESISFRAMNSLFDNVSSFHHGHNSLAIEGSYNVIRGGIYDGWWGDENGGSGVDGSRATAIVPSKRISPYGPVLQELTVLKRFWDSGTGPTPATKLNGFRNIHRLNVLADGDRPYLYQTLNDAANTQRGIRNYNNTIYEVDHGVNVGNINAPTNTPCYCESVLANSIFQEVDLIGESYLYEKVIHNGTTTIESYANGWKDDVIRDNLFRQTSGNELDIRLKDNTDTYTATLAEAETDWPNNWFGNDDAVVTLPNIANRTSAVYATAYNAFEPTSANALATGTAPTQADGAGSGTALTVDDSWYFYAGADAATWDLGWMGEVGDYIKIGSSAIVQIDAINYTTHVITIAASRTWADNDDVFLVMRDGVTIVDNKGAWQVTM